MAEAEPPTSAVAMPRSCAQLTATVCCASAMEPDWAKAGFVPGRG